MKLFPHILARVGGSTFSKVEALSFGKMSFVDILLQRESNLEFQFEKVLQTFAETIEKIHDYKYRAILINGKKDFQNQRFSFLKKIKKINDDEMLSALIFNISVYSDWKMEFENLKKEFDIIFQEEEFLQFSFLKDFFQKEDFQKGLLQSSHSLYHQNKKLASKSPRDFRKKERQTLRALAQYFYRIGAKTSPFSHFTTLDILSENIGIFKNEKLEIKDNFFQFNNFILAEMKSILLQEPSFFRQLNLQINPSISLSNDVFYFIKNAHNIESIQELEASEILRELNQNLIPADGIKFGEVVKLLLELVEADQESLENYLLELIDLGFLAWSWGGSGLTFDWEIQLKKIILSMNDFSNKMDWMLCLENMIKTKSQLESISSKVRYSLQSSLKNNLEKIGLRKVIPELLFFEDVQKGISIQLPKKEIIPIIKSLDALLRLIEPLMVNDFRSRILKCWKQNFAKQNAVPLIYFYEKFYQQTEDDNQDNPFSESRNKEALKKIKSKIKEIGKFNLEGDLIFSINELENIFPKHDLNTPTQYSGLFQFFKKEGELRAVINGLAPGFGKLFGRFLPLFDGEITMQLQKWNSDFQGKDLWIENVDASIFNANLHPPFLNFEIKNSGSQNNLPLENQISIKDIAVIWDEELNEPSLIFSKTKQRISIFDFGFEHPENRSPMFQLLNGFGIEHATFRFFLPLVNELFFVEKPNEVKHFRRIVIDNHLILQRAQQEVPSSFFPKKEKSESGGSYFLKVQKWKKENNIPQFIFIQPIQNQENSSFNFNKDFFKPQLIDLNSPVAIVLLQKVVEKHNGRIRIEEMLPSEQELIGDSVAEFAVQWHGGNS